MSGTAGRSPMPPLALLLAVLLLLVLLPPLALLVLVLVLVLLLLLLLLLPPAVGSKGTEVVGVMATKAEMLPPPSREVGRSLPRRRSITGRLSISRWREVGGGGAGYRVAVTTKKARLAERRPQKGGWRQRPRTGLEMVVRSRSLGGVDIP